VKDYKKDLIQYRLERANESFQDAKILYENNGSPSSLCRISLVSH
jgi:hypothetical protein